MCIRCLNVLLYRNGYQAQGSFLLSFYSIFGLSCTSLNRCFLLFEQLNVLIIKSTHRVGEQNKRLRTIVNQKPEMSAGLMDHLARMQT